MQRRPSVRKQRRRTAAPAHDDLADRMQVAGDLARRARRRLMAQGQRRQPQLGPTSPPTRAGQGTVVVARDPDPAPAASGARRAPPVVGAQPVRPADVVKAVAKRDDGRRGETVDRLGERAAASRGCRRAAASGRAGRRTSPSPDAGRRRPGRPRSRRKSAPERSSVAAMPAELDLGRRLSSVSARAVTPGPLRAALPRPPPASRPRSRRRPARGRSRA